jgi:SAM-dependent methyltransferase
VCGEKPHNVLDLGTMPNANELVKKEELSKVESYPLRFYWCKKCALLQQLSLVESTKLFGDNYTYQTGVSKPVVDHLIELSKDLKKRLPNRKLAVIIASNDGTEIDVIEKEAGFEKVIGVEPAKNMADIANERGLFTINEFFSYAFSKKLLKQFGKVDFVLANNVFAHVPYPGDLLLGVKNILGDEGYVVIEVQWLKDLVKTLSIDTLYAEHYYVWSVKAMKYLARLCGLVVTDITYLPNQQGGSLRFWLRSKGKETSKFEEVEKSTGLYSLAKMKGLQKRANARKVKFRTLLGGLKDKGAVIDIWAVPAKVPTILNFCGIDSTYIRYAYDSTTTKMNNYMPKSNILIKDEKLLNNDMPDKPDYIIIGAWNYMNFAKKKLSWFTEGGGKLIDPLNSRILRK